MYTLPKPPASRRPITDLARSRPIADLAAAFEAVLNAALSNAVARGNDSVLVSPPIGVGLDQYDAFWEAVSERLTDTGWKLDPSNLRDGGASRLVVAAD